jgi:hypothetical protein
MNAHALTLDESVHLAYPLMARIAAEAGVRALAIKGPVAALQGLRAARPSVDVDLLVEPAGYDDLRAALERLGWHDGFVYETPGMTWNHSVVHRHPRWACEIDVHHWFPGLLADPSTVFDLMWSRRVDVELAGAPVAAPDPVGHASILALHLLRDSATDRAQSELRHLAERLGGSWDAARIEDLGHFAADVGASEPLGPFLDLMGAPRVASTVPLAVSVESWRMRSEAETREVLPWLVELRARPWRRRPAFLLRAVWLDDEHFVAWDPAMEPTRRNLMRARWHRLRRAFSALPGALADLRRLRGRR